MRTYQQRVLLVLALIVIFTIGYIACAGSDEKDDSAVPIVDIDAASDQRGTDAAAPSKYDAGDEPTSNGFGW